ncbi:MAG: hypothetical protein ACXVED_20975 [Bacteroidia bacterium]
MKKLRDYLFDSHISYVSASADSEDKKTITRTVRIPKVPEIHLKQVIAICTKEDLNYQIENGMLQIYTVEKVAKVKD